MEQPKARGPNFTSDDKTLLVELTTKYAGIIENKQTDTATNAVKESTWKQLTTDYNSVSVVKRDVKQLKQAYDNIKKRAKKALAEEKVERFRTGGGSCHVPTIDEADLKVLELLGNRATPLRNMFDSDAQYNFETIVLDENGVDSTMSISACTVPMPVSTMSVPMPGSTMSISADASTEPSTVAKKSWAAGKKRFRPASVASIRRDAAATIALSAQYQKEYYEAKLEMAKQHHAVKMRILELKEKNLKKMIGEE